MWREKSRARECVLQPRVGHVTLKCRVPGGFSRSLGLDGRRHGKTSLLALPSSILLTETDCFATYNFETLNHCVCEMEMHFIVRLEML